MKTKRNEMKWYGSLPPISKTTIKWHRNLKRSLTPTALVSPKPSNPNSLYFQISTLMPHRVTILKNVSTPSYISLSSLGPYRFYLPLPPLTNLYVDPLLHKAGGANFYRNSLLPSFFSKIQFFTLSANSFFTVKLKFKGKGYNMFRNYRNSILFKFGFSHRVYGFFNEVSLINLSKTSVLIFSLDKFTLLRRSWDFVSIKPVNLYTGRGIRFARQIIYRKLGKVGSYR